LKKAFLIAPSRYCTKKQINLAKKNLKKIGYEVKFLPSITDKYFYYAGSPERRAKEINHALKDKESKYIFSVSGGMGAIHILNKINLKTKSKKVFVGFSDITILLNILKSNKKIRCLHGPTFGTNSNKISKITNEILIRAIEKKDYCIKIKKEDILVKGITKAKIIGGNLSLLVKTFGTPYEVDTKGKIIFLEQNAYTGRMILDLLWQMKLAGKFNKIKGVILGKFTNSDEETNIYLKDFFKNFNVPVISNQDIGHVPKNITIPLEENCIINTNKKIWAIKF